MAKPNILHESWDDCVGGGMHLNQQMQSAREQNRNEMKIIGPMIATDSIKWFSVACAMIDSDIVVVKSK